MNRYASLVLAAAAAAACLLACSEELPCRTEGAVRTNGVCGCPDGTRYVSDRAAKIDRCVTEGSGSATVGDSGSSTAEAGTGAAFDGGGHADSTKPDRAIDVASEADGQASDVLPSEAGTLAPGDMGSSTAPGDSCSTEGVLRCAMPGAAARLRCVEGRWSSAESCPAAEVCDSSDPLAPVTCHSVVEACKGNADKPACEGATMLFCGKTGLADRTSTCESKLQCEVGLSRGACAPCVPGAFRCTEALLEKCGADGQKYEAVLPACSSAALCNAQAGACTSSACVSGSKTCQGDTLQTCNATLTDFDDQACGAGLCDGVGKQCDVCVPNTKTCEANSVKTCNTQGQDYTTAACPVAQPLCTGNGRCVQCTQTSECPAASECSVALCNAAAGTCGTTFRASGSPCSAGICDGKGACGPVPTCGDGVKNQASEECDDGNRIDQDDCLNNCKAAFCGDGMINMFGMDAQRKEECDRTAVGVSAWECTAACKWTTIYGNCENDSSCSSGETCLGGTCSMFCEASKQGVFGPGSGCPPALAPTRELCVPNMTPACFITGCNSDSDCPEGQFCFKYDDSTSGQIYSSACLNRNRQS